MYLQRIQPFLRERDNIRLRQTNFFSRFVAPLIKINAAVRAKFDCVKMVREYFQYTRLRKPVFFVRIVNQMYPINEMTFNFCSPSSRRKINEVVIKRLERPIGKKSYLKHSTRCSFITITCRSARFLRRCDFSSSLRYVAVQYVSEDTRPTLNFCRAIGSLGIWRGC